MAADESKQTEEQAAEALQEEQKQSQDTAEAPDEAGSAEDGSDAAEVDSTASSEEVSLEDLVEQLQASQQEIEKLKEALLRSEAEAQNIRRRAEKDIEAAHKYGQDKLIKELMPVKDNLERALEAGANKEDSAVRAIMEGVELTDKSFSDTLNKIDVTPISPEGQTFDPQEHQAMSMVENEEVPANTVIAVIQKGYRLKGRVIRPAMVMVSKGGSEAKPNIDETA
ncbi:MAG: nucleotide exchange factor GrpE [Natronospirillum sp.]|uniref:nucleotide exchange factor GrpE n=1 Tax=Natronospirillum sp. TaxID=2812955 RepID=UPI0025FCCC5C|nr:nucleotide exchange factor GrpE [Natronospirillum sp.]MCH8551833.1 nucleotide exchange factor GrpE [Natronospirillum sp.]